MAQCWQRLRQLQPPHWDCGGCQEPAASGRHRAAKYLVLFDRAQPTAGLGLLPAPCESLFDSALWPQLLTCLCVSPAEQPRLEFLKCKCSWLVQELGIEFAAAENHLRGGSGPGDGGGGGGLDTGNVRVRSGGPAALHPSAGSAAHLLGAGAVPAGQHPQQQEPPEVQSFWRHKCSATARKSVKYVHQQGRPLNSKLPSGQGFRLIYYFYSSFYYEIIKIIRKVITFHFLQEHKCLNEMQRSCVIPYHKSLSYQMACWIIIAT